MCRHEYHAHYACSSSSSPIPGRLLMSPSSASMDPGKEALQLASNIARNVIPAGLERFTSSKLPSQPIIEKVSDRVICILGQNPSAFTLNGTNLYIVGTGKRRILIDAGETTPKSGKVISILEDLFKKEGIEGIQEILITHLHHDHYGGAIQIAKRFGCSRISKFPSPQTELDRRRESVRVAQINLGIDPNSNIIPPALEITYSGLDFELNSNYHRLSEGELIKSEGCNLRCFWTPGHAPDHLVFLLEEENSIFSGDHVLGWGTSWVEDLSLYMQSLHKIRLLKPRRLYPGHGPAVQNAKEHVTRYINHREVREKQVLSTMLSLAPFSASENGITSRKLTEFLYPDTKKLDNAEGNVLKILVKLRKEGSVISFDPDSRRLTSLDEQETEFMEKQNGSDGRSDPKVAVEEYEKIWYARQNAYL